MDAEMRWRRIIDNSPITAGYSKAPAATAMGGPRTVKPEGAKVRALEVRVCSALKLGRIRRFQEGINPDKDIEESRGRFHWESLVLQGRWPAMAAPNRGRRDVTEPGK
jgi:hypothetical protein